MNEERDITTTFNPWLNTITLGELYDTLHTMYMENGSSITMPSPGVCVYTLNQIPKKEKREKPVPKQYWKQIQAETEDKKRRGK
jgi:hypothetical protein